MKHILSLLILSFSMGIVHAQKDTTWYDGCNWHHCVGNMCTVTQLNCEVVELPQKNEPILPDSITSQKFIRDSLGNDYIIEYACSYSEWKNAMKPTNEEVEENKFSIHRHIVAICTIIKFKGNRKWVIASGIKAIYSPTDCSSDNEKLWLKRLYELKGAK